MQFLKNLVFIDIETISGHDCYDNMSVALQTLWNKKASYLRNDDNLTAQALYPQRAAIYAEFGRVICISIGYCYYDENRLLNARIKSLTDHNEKDLLERFCELMDHKFDRKYVKLCAHNGREFDFPYLARRMLVNHVPIPRFLQLSGKKPWEIQHHDTLDMWKFGDRKSFTSLELLTDILGLPSPKSDMDGSMVSQLYHESKDLNRIADYCTQDVAATIRLYLRFKGIDTIPEERMHFVKPLLS